jgi:uncharacterized membrane protein YfcA
MLGGEAGVLLLAVLVMVLSAAMGTVAGFGVALLLSPVLAVLYDPITAVLTVTTFGVFNAVIALFGDALMDPRPRPYGRELVLMWVGAALVTAPATVALTSLPQRLVTGMLSVFVLTSVVAIQRGARFRSARPGARTVGTGALSQAANVLSGVGGPPIILYALASDWEPYRTRTTQQVYFIPVNIVTTATVMAATDARPVLALVVVGAVTSAAVLPVRARVASATVYRLMLGLSFVAGTVAGVRAIVG